VLAHLRWDYRTGYHGGTVCIALLPENATMMRIGDSTKLLLLALCLTWLALPAAAQEKRPPKKSPPSLKRYKGRVIAQTMHYKGAPWLVRESRQREEDCKTLIKQLKIKPGQTLCDIGCGNGFYTLKMAKLVGEKGKVYAVDIQPEMLRLLMARALEQNIKNIVPVLGSLHDPHLPAGEIDLVLLVDVYHEFSHPEHMLASIRKCLSSTGRVALGEFRMEDPKVPIKLLHKMSKAQIKKEYLPNGLKLVEEYDKLPWQHLMFFERGKIDEAAKKE
jgi:ubiquinone/menaquinone biosynthesis C-methylase UbiE